MFIGIGSLASGASDSWDNTSDSLPCFPGAACSQLPTPPVLAPDISGEISADTVSVISQIANQPLIAALKRTITQPFDVAAANAQVGPDPAVNTDMTGGFNFSAWLQQNSMVVYAFAGTLLLISLIGGRR